MQYRADITGLRALAVLPVILFHAGLPPFRGGFLGVDVFFVISGYLITTIILSDLKKQTFSFRKFYERRARRILPALFVVLVTCLPLAWITMSHYQFKAFAQSLVAVALFSSNWLFWKDSGYFAQDNEIIPLLHTWSLAVEEQYYIIIPIVLFLIYRYRRAWLVTFLLAFGLISLFLAQWGLGHDPSASFYLLPTRGWELAAGGLLSALQSQTDARSKFVSQFPLAGIGLILISMALFTRLTPHPGFFTLVPVLGTSLILWFGGGKDWGTRMLSSRLFVGIGLISYSLYLWHQPLFAFARLHQVNDLQTMEYSLLIALALLLASLSWKLVEQPFRNRTKIPERTVWGVALVSTLLPVLFGGYIYSQNGFPGHTPSDIQQTLTSEKSNGIKLHVQNGTRCHNRQANIACFIGDPDAQPSYALIGDSHAGALAPSISANLKRAGIKAIQFTTDGCPYALGLKRFDMTSTCPQWNRRVRDRLLKEKIKGVILVGRYVLMLEGTRFDNHQGGVEKGNPVGYTPVAPLQGNRRKQVAKIYRQSIKELLSLGKKVILVYPIPEVGWHVPQTLYKLRAQQHQAILTTSYARYKQRSKAVIKTFDKIGQHKNLIRIYPDHIFCNSFVTARCAANDHEKIFYFDDDHLSLVGGALLANEIIKAL